MVAILARKPWVFARRRLFGWKVRFDIDKYSPAKRKELDYLCAYLLSRNEPQIKLCQHAGTEVLTPFLAFEEGVFPTRNFVRQLRAVGRQKSVGTFTFLAPEK